MVCYCLDLRGDSKVGNFLSNKLVAIITGIVQLALWLSTLLNFIIQPTYVKELIHNMDTPTLVVSIILVLVINVFSSMLLFGLFKSREGLIKCYLIFNMVLTVLFVLSFFFNLFTQPKKFGVSGFLSSILITLLNLLFYFIFRNYYLSLTSKEPNRNLV